MSRTVLPYAKISKDRLLSGAPRLRHLGRDGEAAWLDWALARVELPAVAEITA
jgi:hypothetical protein